MAKEVCAKCEMPVKGRNVVLVPQKGGDRLLHVNCATTPEFLGGHYVRVAP